MTAIKLNAFGGQLPAWDSRLLPDGQATVAVNAYLLSGALIGWRQPKLLYTLKDSTSKYVYRLPNKYTNDTSIFATDSFWMEFASPDTTVMRSPVTQDKYDRIYWVSPGDVPRYDTYDRIVAGQPAWMLGIPASGCAPGVTVEGGGDTVQEGHPHADMIPPFGDYRLGNSVFLIPLVTDGALLVLDVSFMPNSDDANVRFSSVVYSDFNGAPSDLLAVGQEVVGITSGTAASSTFLNPFSIISEVPYWIGIAIDSPEYVAIATTDVTDGVQFANTYSNGPPPTAPNVDTGLPAWQMWSNLEGQSVFEARAYVYTWVSAYGEEGPPSPPTLVNGWSNANWTVECFQPTPDDMGVNRNITTTRIYRTVTSQAGQGTYFWVADIPATQSTYVDTASDATVALNLQLPSLYWTGPPTDLQAIVPFPNGIAVGFRANEIWFSEPYHPHAWPPPYVLTTEFPIVGIGVTGNCVVACTESSPYLITGINPSSMAVTKINLPEPCLSRGPIVTTDTTVLYASMNGLIQISQSGVGANITEGWVGRENWQALAPQKNVRAVKLASSYFAFGSVVDGDNSVAQQGFTVELSAQDQTSFTVWPQAGGHRLGFSQLTSPNGYDIVNVELDPWTGVGLLLQNGGVWFYDFTDQAPIIVPYKWRSKIMQQPHALNFEALKVWFTVPPGTPAQGDRNTSEPQPALADDQYGIVRVYADDQLWTTRELRKSGELLRLYSGGKFESWQFEIESRVRVSNMQVATSAKELGRI
jgi:hypothetical protein